MVNFIKKIFKERRKKKMLEYYKAYFKDFFLENPDGQNNKISFDDYFYIEMSEDGDVTLCLKPAVNDMDKALYKMLYYSDLSNIDSFYDGHKDISTIYYKNYSKDAALNFQCSAQKYLYLLYAVRAEFMKCHFFVDKNTGIVFDYWYRKDTRRLESFRFGHITPMQINLIINTYKENCHPTDIKYIDEYRDYLITRFANTDRKSTVTAECPEVTIYTYHWWLEHIKLPTVRKEQLCNEHKEIISEIYEKRKQLDNADAS